MKLAKIPPTDLRVLLGLLPQLEAEQRAIQAMLVERSGAIFARDCESPAWSHLYELPFLEHVSTVVVALGQQDLVRKIAAAPRQVEALVASIAELDEDDTEFSPAEKEALRPKLARILGLSTSLVKSMRCLMAYGVYLNDLVALVRLGGPKGDQALLKAVRIDPTVLAAPSLQARFCRAVLEDDQKFLSTIKRAINGPLTKQQQANADKIRFVLQVIQDAHVEHLTDDELHELFVKELALYAAPSRTDAGDAAKGIRAIRDRMKKAKATTQ